MNGRIFVPAPAFMMQRDPNQSSIFVHNQPTKKVTTVLTNLQRRNVQTLKVDTPASLNIFQMAAQGEILLLEIELNKCQSNIDVRDKKGFTPLLWASANGQKTIVELLLWRGADAFARGINGETALLLAAARGHHEVVHYLLRAGYDVNESDELGNTALMFATFNNHIAMVTLLLDWGADITAQNADGWDALQIARRRRAKASKLAIERYIISLLSGDKHKPRPMLY
ncbi:unnamed protein product [Rodentolepis nana]|uniref:ANK_REP_REGION domain-containing protein n=1 Tax=Rodentolepis nana TaxID=102285 RepID=A0A0R3T8W2_RODNA|nr:unnamed protein product [Rodentolepis nana]